MDVQEHIRSVPGFYTNVLSPQGARFVQQPKAYQWSKQKRRLRKYGTTHLLGWPGENERREMLCIDIGRWCLASGEASKWSRKWSLYRNSGVEIILFLKQGLLIFALAS